MSVDYSVRRFLGLDDRLDGAGGVPLVWTMGLMVEFRLGCVQ